MRSSARAGDSNRATSLADEIAEEFPSDTLIQKFWLVTTRASIEINLGNPARASELLEQAVPYDLAGAYTDLVVGTMYPVYVRGQAYLRLHRGHEASAEFQMILDRRSGERQPMLRRRAEARGRTVPRRPSGDPRSLAGEPLFLPKGVIAGLHGLQLA
jgi:hypothetical protein